VLSDGVALTVKLRHGVRFTDGKELRSRDINYSLQQLLAPSTGSYVSGLAKQFAALTLDSKPESVLADPDKAADVARSVSKFDFQVLQRTVDGGALRAFAEPALAPVSAAAHSRDPQAFSSRPVCVGPYVLAKPYRGGDREITLTRSKSYYGKNVGYTSGGTGYADSIVFTIFPTAAAAIAAYDKGQVDVVQVPRDQVARTKDVASRVYGLATGVEYLGLPGVSTGPFSDADLRLALSLAVDRTKLVGDVFGPAAQVATGFEPPVLEISKGRSLANKEVKGAPLASCGDRTPATPDLTRARAALGAVVKRAGKPLTGFTLEVNDDAPYPAMARAVAEQWRTGLGLDVKVVTSDWRSYLAKGTGGTGFTSPFRMRWSTDATAPEPTYNNQQRFLAPLAAEAGATLANWSHYSDRSFEFALAETAGRATEVGERGVAFAALSRQLCEQLPMIPLAFDRPAFLVRSTVLGSARSLPVGRDGGLLLRELYLR
jgi:ABC-type transport system substrate-binding protein